MTARTFISLGTLLFLLCSAAHAQEATPRTSEGDRALLFSINGFGNFGVRGVTAGSIGSGSLGDSSSGSATPVYGVGAKLFIGPKVALRAALGFGSVSSADSNGGSSSAFGITPAVEFHLVQSGAVTGYLGGFASFAVSSSGSGGEGTDYSRSATSIGLGTILGVEFYPWNGISLGAEYQLGVRFNSSSTTVGGTASDGPGTTEIGIGTVAVTLGVYL